MSRAILSTTILLEEGTFAAREISLDAARVWLAAAPADNFCGHETVRVLGIEPAKDRHECPGYDEALCLKPRARLEFGREYTAAEVETIGVQFTLITRIEPGISPDSLLTPAEAAVLFGGAESSWRNRAASGEIPGAFKKGKQWLIPKSAILQ